MRAKSVTNEHSFLADNTGEYPDNEGEGFLEVVDYAEFLRIRVVTASGEDQDAVDLDLEDAWRLAVHLLEALGPR